MLVVALVPLVLAVLEREVVLVTVAPVLVVLVVLVLVALELALELVVVPGQELSGQSR